MSENQNWNNVGDQIKDALQDALDTGDFKQLNTVVAGTVNSALTEAKRQMKSAVDSANSGYHSGSYGQGGNGGNGGFYGGHGGAGGGGQGATGAAGNFQAGAGGYGQTGNTGTGYARNGSWNQTKYNYQAWNYNTKKDTFHYKNNKMNGGVYTSQIQPDARKSMVTNAYKTTVNAVHNKWSSSNLPAVKTRKVGQVSGTLYLVFGGIGTGIMGCALVIVLLMIISSLIQSIWPLLTIGFFLLLFLMMIERGCVKKERLKRAKRYVELCDGKTYANIEDLALQMGKSKRFIVRDLKKMLKMGFFPEGHLDEKETCLMLDDATYRDYIRLQKERKVQEMEDKMAKMRDKRNQGTESFQEEAVQKEQADTSEQDGISELDAMIIEGQECIRKLRDMNDAIEGEVISTKLFQLENLLKEIFDRVQDHPEQMTQMHKFMNYYLPTTLKLVQAYAEFDNVSVPGADIQTAQSEIEKTLDTINSAFTELLNNLFRDSVFDVTTDAQVLQTMLAKEGLTREMELERVPRS